MRALVASMVVATVAPAASAALVDSQNRQWFLDYGAGGAGKRYETMAAIYDPLTGEAGPGSGVFWATAAEVMSFLSEVDYRAFFETYPCTFFVDSCAPPRIDLLSGPQTVFPRASGFGVFGGVVREPLVFSERYQELAQTNIFAAQNWAITFNFSPDPADWTLYVSSGYMEVAQIPARTGESTQDGRWVYSYVPAPPSLALLGVGALGLGLAMRRRPTPAA